MHSRGVRYPLGKRRRVVIDPGIAYGQPSIRGVPTRVLYGPVAAGDSVAMVARWFGVTKADVSAACEFEMKLRAAKAALAPGEARKARRLETELGRLTLTAGKAPSRAAWRILTTAAEQLGFESVAQASWCGQFLQVLRVARSLVVWPTV